MTLLSNLTEEFFSFLGIFVAPGGPLTTDWCFFIDEVVVNCVDWLLKRQELSEILKWLEVWRNVEGLLFELLDFAVLEREHVAVGSAKIV